MERSYYEARKNIHTMVVKHVILKNSNTNHIWIDIYGNVNENNPGWSDYNTFSYYKLKPYSYDIYNLQLKDILKYNEHKFGTVVSIRSLDGNKCLICTVDYEDELVIEDLEFLKIEDILNTQVFILKLGEMILPDYLMLIYAGDINNKKYYYHGYTDFKNNHAVILDKVSETALLRKYGNIKGFKLK